MKYFIAIAFLLLTQHCFSQKKLKLQQVRVDTCIFGKSSIGSSALKGNPIHIANGIIVSRDELNPDLISDVSVLQCPNSFAKYSYLGSQGAIVITTKQSFDVTTPKEIQESKKIDGEILFAVNTLFLRDSSMRISLRVINEIETVIVADPSNLNATKMCINIWTVPKKDREKYFFKTL